MTRLRARCGCGWLSTPASQSKLNTVQQAIQHSDDTGHAVDVMGVVRPSKQGPIVKNRPNRNPFSGSRNVPIQSTSSDAELRATSAIIGARTGRFQSAKPNFTEVERTR